MTDNLAKDRIKIISIIAKRYCSDMDELSIIVRADVEGYEELDDEFSFIAGFDSEGNLTDNQEYPVELSPIEREKLLQWGKEQNVVQMYYDEKKIFTEYLATVKELLSESDKIQQEQEKIMNKIEEYSKEDSTENRKKAMDLFKEARKLSEKRRKISDELMNTNYIYS